MGIGGGLVSAIMSYPELKSELNSYKNDKDINFEELKKELTAVLTKAMYEEAQERGLVNKIEKQIKNTKWNN
jgi:SPX domain protein involved in polyphosphate accumulation